MLNLRDLHDSHTLGCAGNWNHTGIPEDRDEVNRREVFECDGWVCDLETIGVPSILRVVRNAAALVRAKWHVRVSKQSCKQANCLILWGCSSTKIFFPLDFYLFDFSKNLKKYDLTRPKVPKYSLTSWPEVIVVFHGEYKRTVTQVLTVVPCVRRPPWATVSSCRGLTSTRWKSASLSSLELMIIATGALASSVPVEGSHSYGLPPLFLITYLVSTKTISNSCDPPIVCTLCLPHRNYTD